MKEVGTDDWSWRISGIVCKWPVILCDGSERRRGRERVGEEWRDEICRTDEKKVGRRRELVEIERNPVWQCIFWRDCKRL